MENNNWTNWGEPQQEDQPQNLTWGEPQQEDQPNNQWKEQLNEVNNQSLTDWEDQTYSYDEVQSNNKEQGLESELDNLVVEDWEKKSSCLGLVTRLDINVLLYNLNYDNNKIVDEIEESGLEALDQDGRFKTKFENNPELLKVLTAIKKIGESRGLKLDHTFIYKNSPNESTINISRGESFYNFIYFIQANYNSGEVILDFSSLKGGPSVQAVDSSSNILAILPGWVPYSISKNISDKDMIAIAGRFLPLVS